MKSGEWQEIGLAEFKAEFEDNVTVVEVDMGIPDVIVYVAVENPERMNFRGKYRAIWLFDTTHDCYMGLLLPQPMNRFEMDMYVADRL